MSTLILSALPATSSDEDIETTIQQGEEGVAVFVNPTPDAASTKVFGKHIYI